ncbi:hypothetical protein PHMEG_00021290 [Phytophthora megakarya]|uniref:Uncharacterized protein n=1 Tax=Phytophthora megakarya TaxID=4795 RepID=A0A225VNY0_9STRA|nr:hypothetical protein PHMEG_00021290 [Phytophthora megakarya]
MPGYTVESDGDVEMSLHQSILRGDPRSRFEWLREWERCVEKLRRRCTPTGETFRKVVAAVKAQDTSNLATYVLKETVTDETDADIMQAVKSHCSTLKMDLSIDDCDTRVFRCYEGFNGIVEVNEWLSYRSN